MGIEELPVIAQMPNIMFNKVKIQEITKLVTSDSDVTIV